MKRLLLTATLLQTMLYPTLPGTTIRDYSQPGIRINGNQIYQTLPGTTVRDYSGPSYKIEPPSNQIINPQPRHQPRWND